MRLTRGRDAEDEADRLVNAAKGSLAAGSEVADAYGTCIRSSVGMILGLDEAIADKLLPRVIASEFGDIARFEVNPKTGRKAGMYKRLLAYAGAEPRIRESGGWRGQAHMSKRGSGSLRTALFQLAFCISRNDDHFRTVYERQINRGKHHNVALSYVMADFPRIVCSLWKSGREYTVKNPNASKTVA